MGWQTDGVEKENNRRDFKNGLSRNDHNISDVRASLLKRRIKKSVKQKSTENVGHWRVSKISL